jgi:hypothetical protein
LDDGRFGLGVLVLHFLVEVNPHHHQQVQFLFYLQGSGRLEGAEELDEDGLAKDEYGRVEVVRVFDLCEPSSIGGVFLREEGGFFDGAGQNGDFLVFGAVHVDVAFDEVAIDEIGEQEEEVGQYGELLGGAANVAVQGVVDCSEEIFEDEGGQLLEEFEEAIQGLLVVSHPEHPLGGE